MASSSRSGRTPWRPAVKSTSISVSIRRPSRAARRATASIASPSSAEWIQAAWAAIFDAVPRCTFPMKCQVAPGTRGAFAARSWA